MSTQDAYAPPQSTVRDINGGTGLMTDNIIASLRKTRPWVLLLAVIGFISTAFIVIAAIGAVVGGGMLSADLGPGGFLIFGMAALYLVLGIVYFMASWYLLKYAGAIKRAVSSMSQNDLEDALSRQASFWKLLGVLTLIGIVVTIVMLVFGIGGAMFMGGEM